jgi:hypothetical protein
MNKRNIERTLKECTRTQKNKYNAEYQTIDLKKVREIFGPENIIKKPVSKHLNNHQVLVLGTPVAEIFISDTGALKKIVPLRGVKPMKLPVNTLLIRHQVIERKHIPWCVYSTY